MTIDEAFGVKFEKGGINSAINFEKMLVVKAGEFDAFASDGLWIDNKTAVAFAIEAEGFEGDDGIFAATDENDITGVFFGIFRYDFGFGRYGFGIIDRSFGFREDDFGIG